VALCGAVGGVPVAGPTLGGVGGAVVGAGLGALVGANTTRLEEDLGLKQNSRTGLPGNPVYDVLFNSIIGARTDRSTASQKLFNEKLVDEKFKETRSALIKDLRDAKVNKNEPMANSLLGQIVRTFSQQYDNPSEAQRAFNKYMEDQSDKFQQDPLLRSWSKEDLVKRLREAGQFAAQHRTAAAQKMVQDIRNEIIKREISRRPDEYPIGYDLDFDFDTQETFEIGTEPKKRKKKRGLFR